MTEMGSLELTSLSTVRAPGTDMDELRPALELLVATVVRREAYGTVVVPGQWLSSLTVYLQVTTGLRCDLCGPNALRVRQDKKSPQHLALSGRSSSGRQSPAFGYRIVPWA